MKDIRIFENTDWFVSQCCCLCSPPKSTKPPPKPRRHSKPSSYFPNDERLSLQITQNQILVCNRCYCCLCIRVYRISQKFSEFSTLNIYYSYGYPKVTHQKWASSLPPPGPAGGGPGFDPHSTKGQKVKVFIIQWNLVCKYLLAVEHHTKKLSTIAHCMRERRSVLS